MIDFQQTQNIIQQFIDDNYQQFLDKVGLANFKTVTDYLDFDKYKNDFIVNIDFDNITFPNDRSNDDCYSLQQLLVNIYILHRNDTPNKLNEKMLNAASAFYSLILLMNSENLFYDININRVDFFKYIEGATNIMASKFTLQINKEV